MRWSAARRFSSPPLGAAHPMTEHEESSLSLLRLQSVTQSYWRGPRELRVLRGASLDVDAGSLVSIYGQRNAGKTALLEIAAGFQQPSSGEVTFDGTSLASLSARQLARVHREQIGWIERAGPHARELTVGQYVALPLYRDLGPRRAQRRALEALAAYDVEDRAGERWDELSDVARILCAIAQAMVRRPRLLIADDPTAGLGIIDRERVCSVLRSAAEDDGLGVLMAVPDMPAMLQAHEVRLLSRGRLLAPAQRSQDADATVLDFPGNRRSA
jgi:ABC-type lipoprotein export system ATPase subunit